jgi:hypothetical protein
MNHTDPTIRRLLERYWWRLIAIAAIVGLIGHWLA